MNNEKKNSALIHIIDDKFVQVPLPNIVYLPEFESKLNQNLNKNRQMLKIVFTNQ